MVSQKFMQNLYTTINKKLSGIVNAQLTMSPIGSGEDQSKGIGDDLKVAFIPFSKSRYEAQEFLYVRIPVYNQYFSFMDMVTPILNVSGKSVQGIATFATMIRYPVAETFVDRMVGFSYKLFPHSLVVDQGIAPKEVIKKNLTTSQAINAINNDKKVYGKIHGFSDCKIQDGWSSKYYNISIDWMEYPPGLFTAVPYRGSTILIAKESGFGGSVDDPSYEFKDRYESFLGVAQYIAQYPEKREDIGKFYVDTPLALVLKPLLEHLDREKKKVPDKAKPVKTIKKPVAKAKVEEEPIEVEVVPECPSCGEPIEKGAKICPSCNSQL